MASAYNMKFGAKILPVVPRAKSGRRQRKPTAEANGLAGTRSRPLAPDSTVYETTAWKSRSRKPNVPRRSC